jgi:hypothetical protein
LERDLASQGNPFTFSAARKRKASASVDDDDEVEIIEGPVPANPKKPGVKPKPKKVALFLPDPS